MKYIGTKRQFFWNDQLLDMKMTNARLQLSDRPIRREIVLDFHEVWEGDFVGYSNFFYDEEINKYRMYYGVSVLKYGHRDNFGEVTDKAGEPDVRFCYAESEDGLHWVKPNLGLHEIAGNKDNNVIIPETDGNTLDNFFVYKDVNPNCPREERYKGIGYDTIDEITERKSGVPSNRVLLYWKSADGIYFDKPEILELEGRFDTLNTVYWNPEDQLYHIYFRDIHVDPSRQVPGGSVTTSWVREIRHAVSKDFRNWSESEVICFQENAPDLQLYTNGVIPYYRGKHMWIGFPTRYYEYSEWLPNFDYLPAIDVRKHMIENLGPRSGLALTDCTFMCSENQKNWYRFEEAYFTPGPENQGNWFYGCCFPCIGHMETINEFGERELSMLMRVSKFVLENERLKKRAVMCRYTMRVDGFACVHADASDGHVLTKPFCFEGERLEMNFRTSAGGQVKVSLTDAEGNVLDGFAEAILFGDSIDRPVNFEGELKTLNGKEVRMKLEMKDAEVYSFTFKRGER